MAAIILPTGIIYLDSNRLMLYTSSGRVLPLDLPREVVSDFEITSKEKLSVLIKEFVQSKEVDPCNLVAVFSPSLCFEKNFPELPTEQKEGQTRDFFDAVPFERILSRVYPFEKGSKAIAVNREYFDAFSDIFAQLGFQFYAVIPAYALTLLGIKSLDPKSAAGLMNRVDAIKQQTMILIRQQPRSLQEQEEQLAREHTPLILFIFFLFIIVVIAVTFVVLNRQSAQNRQPARVTTQLASSTPQASLAPATPGVTVVQKSEVTVKILAGESKTEDAEQLLATISEAGYEQVQVEPSLSTRARILVSLSTLLAPALKQELIQLVEEFSSDAVLQETDQDPLVITIDMGR